MYLIFVGKGRWKFFNNENFHDLRYDFQDGTQNRASKPGTVGIYVLLEVQAELKHE